MIKAKQVLDCHWDGLLPVRPEIIARRHGIKILPVNCGVDADTQNKQDGIIWYDPKWPSYRIRFIIARELGRHLNPPCAGFTV